jgi:transcriptional regulator with XRE-family HTH domain
MLALARVRRLAKSGEARVIRVEAGLSLAELGLRVGVGPATVHRWEMGKRSPHGEPALAYAAALAALGQVASA